MSPTRSNGPPAVSRCATPLRPLAGGPRVDTVLMETPYETVLAALTLDTKLNLRFIRTGNRAEGARVALVNVAPLLAPRCHWDIELAWDSDRMRVAICEQHARGGRRLEGHWPRSEWVLAAIALAAWLNLAQTQRWRCADPFQSGCLAGPVAPSRILPAVDDTIPELQG